MRAYPSDAERHSCHFICSDGYRIPASSVFISRTLSFICHTISFRKSKITQASGLSYGRSILASIDDLTCRFDPLSRCLCVTHFICSSFSFSFTMHFHLMRFVDVCLFGLTFTHLHAHFICHLHSYPFLFLLIKLTPYKNYVDDAQTHFHLFSLSHLFLTFLFHC